MARKIKSLAYCLLQKVEKALKQIQHSRMLITGNENEDDRNVMVNFKPGEYTKKMIFHSVTPPVA